MLVRDAEPLRPFARTASDELIALDEALEALKKQDERKGVSSSFYFGGMTQEEIASVLDVHVNTVARDLKLAEAWIQRHLEAD